MKSTFCPASTVSTLFFSPNVPHSIARTAASNLFSFKQLRTTGKIEGISLNTSCIEDEYLPSTSDGKEVPAPTYGFFFSRTEAPLSLSLPQVQSY